MSINADTINNQIGGRLNASDMRLHASKDINNIGGLIDARNSLVASAGHNINLVSSTSASEGRYGNSRSNGHYAITGLDRIAGLYVGTGEGSNPAGLQLSAGNDLNLTGAVLSNDGTGQSHLSAGHDLNLDTVKTSSQIDTGLNLGHQTVHDSQRSSSEIGTNINSRNGIVLSAGNDLNATAASVNSETGNLIAQAGHDLNIQAGHSTSDSSHSDSSTSSSLFSHKSSRHTSSTRSDTSIASAFTGHQVLLGAGHDANINGSNIVSDTQTWIDAKHDVNIGASSNHTSSSASSRIKKSGIMSGGGASLFIGSSKSSAHNNSEQTTHSGSLIASNAGDIKITAGHSANIAGSDVIAQHDISILGQDVNISDVNDSANSASHSQSKSTGLTLSLGGTIGNAANSVIGTLNQASAARDRGNNRLATAYTAESALSVGQAAQSIYQDATDTSAANKSAQGPIIALNASLGTSKSRNNDSMSSSTSQSSHISAGHQLNITATGDGSTGADGYANNGDINITGSSLNGQTINLDAARDLNFASGLNTASEHSNNTSSSASIGASIGISAAGGVSATVNGNVSSDKGHTDNASSTHTASQINASQHLNIHSGRDTNINGAQLHSAGIDAEIGRNLAITSDQDSSTTTAKQNSFNAGISIPIYGVGNASLNISNNQQKANSSYTSVTTQSGLYAGKDGYTINVKGHSQLNGGVIASTADASHNQLNTGSLSYSNLENTADYKISDSSMGLGTGSLLSQAERLASAALPNSLNHGDSASSTTYAAISPGRINIANQAASAQQLNGLSRDANNATNALTPIFDLQKEQDNMAMGQVVGTIGQQAAAITASALTRGAYVKLDHAQAQAEASPGDKGAQEQLAQAQLAYQQAQNQYGPGSTYSMVAQSITGLAAGLAAGNKQQGISAAIQPLIANQIGQYFDDQVKAATANGQPTAGIEAARALAHAAAGAAEAYLAGNSIAAGASGAATGESIAHAVIAIKFGGKPVDQLTATEKEEVRAISTLAAGMVGAVTGGGFEGAVTGGNAGYNSAVNNDLSLPQDKQASKELSSACMSGGSFTGSSGCMNTISKWEKASAANMAMSASPEVWKEFSDKAQETYDSVRKSCNGDNQCVQLVNLMQVKATVSAFPYVNGGAYDFSASPSLEERAKVDKIAVNSAKGNWGRLAVQAGLDALDMASATMPIPQSAGELKVVKEETRAGANWIPREITGCFTAGTLVHTPHGVQAIETLKVNDLVLSRSDEHSAVGFKPVLGLKITPNQMIYRLTVTNEQGEADEINTSPEHPFWVRDYGWLKAMYLEEGMTLVNEHDEPLRVQSLEKTENVDTVYNIEVEDWHTYFVGALAVWVHNQCMTTPQATETAKELGYTKIPRQLSKGQAVYYNPKAKDPNLRYITQDIGSGNGMGSHNGGVWKGATTIQGLASKSTRGGTYDAKLYPIGK